MERPRGGKHLVSPPPTREPKESVGPVKQLWLAAACEPEAEAKQPSRTRATAIRRFTSSPFVGESARSILRYVSRRPSRVTFASHSQRPRGGGVRPIRPASSPAALGLAVTIYLSRRPAGSPSRARLRPAAPCGYLDSKCGLRDIFGTRFSSAAGPE